MEFNEWLKSKLKDAIVLVCMVGKFCHRESTSSNVVHRAQGYQIEHFVNAYFLKECFTSSDGSSSISLLGLSLLVYLTSPFLFIILEMRSFKIKLVVSGKGTILGYSTAAPG